MRGVEGALIAAALCAASSAGAEACREVTFERNDYVVCSFEVAETDLRLFHSGAGGELFGSFERINSALGESGARLGFAMNAGMYHADRDPVGLYVEEGERRAPAVASAGPGNFGMLPNGILCLMDDRADVVETRAYLDDPPACRFATQSGPMLVIDGELHPRFLPDSTSRRVRNGVGVSDDGGRVHFAISEEPVIFHDFARLFRERLGTPQALYLDGSSSRLRAPALGRNDGGLPMGPVVGAVVAPD